MESRLHTAMIEIGGNLDETTERARITLSGAGSQNLVQFDSRLDEIAVMIDTRLQTLDDVVGDKGEKLVDRPRQAQCRLRRPRQRARNGARREVRATSTTSSTSAPAR